MVWKWYENAKKVALASNDSSKPLQHRFPRILEGERWQRKIAYLLHKIMFFSENCTNAFAKSLLLSKNQRPPLQNHFFQTKTWNAISKTMIFCKKSETSFAKSCFLVKICGCPLRNHWFCESLQDNHFFSIFCSQICLRIQKNGKKMKNAKNMKNGKPIKKC